MSELIGKIIENYKFISLLGKGGMGVVYKAQDIKLERYVAIKILSSHLIDSPRLIERFKIEAKNQAKLSHPNIVTVYGFIEYKNLLGIVMEYVEGESLDKIVYKNKRLNLGDSVYILKQVLSGIGYAHSRGFIHRDIKPSNIILNTEGVAKIMDFGISKSLFQTSFTKTGAKIGTIYYMSPEQIRGQLVTHHSDIYSLGCTLFEMLNGNPPFDSDSEYEVMEGHLKKDVPKLSKLYPELPENIDDVIKTSLQKNPNERFQSCEEFIESLRKIDKLIALSQTTVLKRKKKNPKYVRMYSIAAFIGFIGVLLALSYFAFYQVDGLFKSGKINEFKRYSIQSIFTNEGEINFSKFQKLETNITHSINSLYFINENRGVAVGDSSLFLETFDGGNTWQQKKFESSSNFNDIVMFDNGTAFLLTDSSTFLTSNNFFETFERFEVTGNYSLMRVYFKDPLTGFIIGSRGLVLKTDNMGKNWYKIDTPTDKILFDISFNDDEEGIIVGWDGLILKSTDNGVNWNSSESITRKYLKSIDFINNDLGLVSGGGGEIFRTFDAGSSWIPVAKDILVPIQRIKFLDEEKAIAVGNRGLFIYSGDAGLTWQVVDTKSFANLTNIFITEAGKIFITGVNGTILRAE